MCKILGRLGARIIRKFIHYIYYIIITKVRNASLLQQIFILYNEMFAADLNLERHKTDKVKSSGIENDLTRYLEVVKNSKAVL